MLVGLPCPPSLKGYPPEKGIPPVQSTWTRYSFTFLPPPKEGNPPWKRYSTNLKKIFPNPLTWKTYLPIKILPKISSPLTWKRYLPTKNTPKDFFSPHLEKIHRTKVSLHWSPRLSSLAKGTIFQFYVFSFPWLFFFCSSPLAVNHTPPEEGISYPWTRATSEQDEWPFWSRWFSPFLSCLVYRKASVPLSDSLVPVFVQVTTLLEIPWATSLNLSQNDSFSLRLLNSSVVFF